MRDQVSSQPVTSAQSVSQYALEPLTPPLEIFAVAVGRASLHSEALSLALTPSHRRESQRLHRDFQMLEHLGDGVLDMLIPHALFSGSTAMSQIPNYLGSGVVLRSDALYAEFAKQLGIVTLIDFSNIKLSLKSLEDRLADHFEAVCGAMSLYAGYDELFEHISKFMLNRYFREPDPLRAHEQPGFSESFDLSPLLVEQLEEYVGHQFSDLSLLQVAVDMEAGLAGNSRSLLEQYHQALLIRCGQGTKKCIRAQEVFHIASQDPRISIDQANQKRSSVEERIFRSAGSAPGLLTHSTLAPAMKDPVCGPRIRDALLGAVIMDGGFGSIHPHVIASDQL